MTTAAVDKKISDAPHQDARRQLELILPPIQELFPLMAPERAEHYFDLLAFMSIDDYSGAPWGWWTHGIGPRGKKFLCRVACVDHAHAVAPWMTIPAADRARLIAAFIWLTEWTNSINPPLPLFRAASVDPV